jgi:hypothetical protein
LFLFIGRISLVVLDHGADRVGNISSTVDTEISRNIAVDSIVHFNFKGRTSPRVVDSDLTAVADYWSHWHIRWLNRVEMMLMVISIFAVATIKPTDPNP